MSYRFYLDYRPRVQVSNALVELFDERIPDKERIRAEISIRNVGRVEVVADAVGLIRVDDPAFMQFDFDRFAKLSFDALTEDEQGFHSLFESTALLRLSPPPTLETTGRTVVVSVALAALLDAWPGFRPLDERVAATAFTPRGNATGERFPLARPEHFLGRADSIPALRKRIEGLRPVPVDYVRKPEFLLKTATPSSDDAGVYVYPRVDRVEREQRSDDVDESP